MKVPRFLAVCVDLTFSPFAFVIDAVEHVALKMDTQLRHRQHAPQSPTACYIQHQMHCCRSHSVVLQTKYLSSVDEICPNTSEFGVNLT